MTDAEKALVHLMEASRFVTHATDSLHYVLTNVSVYAACASPGAVTDIKLDLERLAVELDGIIEDLKKAGPGTIP